MLKWSLPLLGISILLLIGIFIHKLDMLLPILVRPEPTQIEQKGILKTYTNNKYSFSLEYPANWSLFELNDRNVRIIKGVHRKEENIEDPTFQIEVNEPAQYTSISDYIKFRVAPSWRDKFEPTKFLNYNAMSTTTDYNYIVIFNKDKYIYSIDYSSSSSGINLSEEDKKKFIQILDSFHFN